MKRRAGKTEDWDGDFARSIKAACKKGMQPFVIHYCGPNGLYEIVIRELLVPDKKV